MLAVARRAPLVAVNHVASHIYACRLAAGRDIFPCLGLVVSGGHTALFRCDTALSLDLLGGTRDDAAGEAFDKVAKLLGLPYPGGPHVERLAATGDPSRFRFARPMLRRDQQPGDSEYYDLSFSGLKTAVLNAVRAGTPDDHPHIARAFHEAIVDTLVEKTARAVAQRGRTRVVLGGGVAGNRTLVAAMRTRMKRHHAEVFAPSVRIATDNAAMIARAGLFHLERGVRSPLDLNAFASLPLPGLVSA
jgi:N6-L-threonylcarbamoyladenine synthase